MKDQLPLKNRISFVAGAGKGIGAASAGKLSEMGSSIIAVSRTGNDLDRLKGRLSGGGHFFYSMDLSEKDSGKRLLEIFHENGYPDVFVACANRRREYAALSSGRLEFSSDTLYENAGYILETLPQILKKQKENHFGRWIAVSSMAAAVSGPGQGLYAAQKSMLESLFRSIALENASFNITANTVSPGFIETEATRENFSNQNFEMISAMNAAGRAGTPDEVAHAVGFLADPMASYITGITLPVAGGYTLGWPLLNLPEKKGSES